jgi:hypothetical protein
MPRNGRRNGRGSYNVNGCGWCGLRRATVVAGEVSGALWLVEDGGQELGEPLPGGGFIAVE